MSKLVRPPEDTINNPPLLIVLFPAKPPEDTAATTCAATVITNSWDGGEYAGETVDEIHFNHPGVQITVASGDNGYNFAMDGFPVSSRYVTAVGGTTLSGNFPGPHFETTWNDANGATGSLCSSFIPQPAYQAALGTATCSMRSANDVSANAGAGVAIYDTFGGTGPNKCTAWCAFIGTSVATPIIAGVYALAGNGATAGYGWSYTHGPFHDITTGSNGPCGNYLCNAGPGYDGPTGNGTPNGIGGF